MLSIRTSRAVAANQDEPACYIHVNGGFGNQLFQYAFARRLHLELGTNVKLDVCAYTQSSHLRKAHQRLVLDQLELPIEIVSLPLWSYELARKLHKCPGAMQRLLTGLEFRKENQPPDWATPASYDQVVINGGWQQLGCFAGSADQISAELREGLGVKQGVQQQSDTVSFHVRRGDYLDVDYMARLDYRSLLRNARAHFKSIGNRNWRFKVFSDDLQWCRKELEGDDLVFPTGVSMLEDFRDMISCEHNIISNSTFSWWAAYLNPNPEKIVCAPSRWMAGRGSRELGLLPDNWIELGDTEPASSIGGPN